MKAKRLITLALLSAMLVSCGGGSAGTDTTAADAGDTTTAPVETEPLKVTDDLPDTLDFKGRELRIYSSLNGSKEGSHHYLLFEESGDVLDDAVYKRNLAVCERFGITMVEDCDAYQNSAALARTLANAGDDAYDLFATNDRDMLTLVSEGAMYFIDEIPLIDFDKPYWMKTMNDCITIGGRKLMAYSEMVLNVADKTHALVFNKQMAEDLDLGDIYTLVDEGKWTFDKFREYGKTATQDLNGDSVYGDEDRYGWAVAPKQVSPVIWVAGGAQSITKDADDIPVYTMNNEKMLNLLEDAYSLSHGDSFWYKTTANGTDITKPPLFANKQVLFAGTRFMSLFNSYYRDLTFDYGIIPYPKADENQDKYYSRCEGSFPFGVPITVEDTEFVGAVLEAMGCESYNIVRPAYYEVALKDKFTHDDQSKRILDMIMDNRVYDLGDTLFTNYIRDGFVVKILNQGKQVLASDIEANRSAVEAAIKTSVDAVKAKQ